MTYNFKSYILKEKNMFLNVILTILVIVLIVISTGVYLWWKRYGSNLFKMMNTFKQGTPKMTDMPKMSDMPNMPNLKNSIEEFRKAMDMLNKMNKK